MPPPATPEARSRARFPVRRRADRLAKPRANRYGRPNFTEQPHNRALVTTHICIIERRPRSPQDFEDRRRALNIEEEQCLTSLKPSPFTPVGALIPRPAPSRCRSTRPPPISSRAPSTPPTCSRSRSSATSIPGSGTRPRTCSRSASPRSKGAWRRWRSRAGRRPRPSRCRTWRGPATTSSPRPTFTAAPGTCSPTR